MIEPDERRHPHRRRGASASATRCELRRGIGYVIQQVGLFPHRTIADNIADRAAAARLATAARSARASQELLDAGRPGPRRTRDALPGAALRRPAAARRRRPRARRRSAGDADGRAVRRDRPDHARRDCRTSSCASSERSRKTIVFVTHDIDEAIKMGDRIAILRRAALAQYDTPAAILRARPTTSSRTSSAPTAR